MELTTDLLSIQTIIGECQRQVGVLSRIIHKGGNEGNISFVVDKIQQFLLLKSYITEEEVVSSSFRNDSELEKILLFLILNTTQSDQSLINIKEYSHLVNIMPQCSKFLLINIAYGTELIDVYCKVVCTLPLPIIAEMFETADDLFVGEHGCKILKNANIIAKALIGKVNSTEIQDNQILKHINNVNSIIVKLVKQLSVLPAISMPNASECETGLHFGYTLYALLKLLLLVDETNQGCAKIIDALILNTSYVLKQVTVNIFCVWAEVEEDDLPFQYALGTEAYRVIEKYTKFKPAAELNSHLTCMAKKPMTLKEIISGASIASIVNHINDNDENQRQWFAALIRKSDIFDSPKSRECLQRYGSLCTLDEVFVLLERASSKDDASKRLAIKCAAHLSIQNLSILIARSFWIDQPWKTYIQFANVTPQLTLLLNKMQNGCNEDLIRDVQLLFLENAPELITILFKECIKNEIYVKWLEEFFKTVNNVISMNNFPLIKLAEIVSNVDQLQEGEQRSITHLLNMLIRTKCADIHKLFENVLKPIVTAAHENNQRLDIVLKIVKELPLHLLDENNKEELCMELLSSLEKHRIKYSEFCPHRIGICTSSIDILTNLSDSFEDLTKIREIELNKINSYYVTLTDGKSRRGFLNHVFPNFVEDSYGEMISKLIKILSRCVTQEWLQITEELAINISIQKATESFTDALILICEVTNTQNTDNVTVFSALEYYLSNYGICLQKMQEKDTSTHFKMEVVKNICRLLKALPIEVKYKEGVKMINLFSENALQNLSKNKQFIQSLTSIGDEKVTQIIANKMLDTRK